MLGTFIGEVHTYVYIDVVYNVDESTDFGDVVVPSEETCRKGSARTCS